MRLPIACLSLLLAAVVVAEEEGELAPFRATASLSGEYHTNVRGEADDQARSGLIYLAQLEASGGQEAEKYSWSLNGDFGFREYQHELLDEYFRARAVGNLRWLFVPQSLEWHLDYVESTRLIDPAQPDVSSNTESIRTLGTGPEVLLRLTERDSLTFSARHQLIQSGEQDYTRDVASVGLGHQIRPLHRLYVRGDARQSNYDGLQPDYRIENAVGGYGYTGRRLNFSADGGKSVLREEGFDDQYQDIHSLRAVWKVHQDRLLTLNGRQVFSDQGSELYYFAEGSNQASLSGSNAAREKYGDLTYSGGKPWFDPSVTLWALQREYVRALPNQLDLREQGARIGTRFLVDDATHLALRYRQVRRDFTVIARQDDDQEVHAALVRKIRSRLVVSVYSGWFRRDSTDVAAEYRDVSAGLEAEVEIR